MKTNFFKLIFFSVVLFIIVSCNKANKEQSAIGNEFLIESKSVKENYEFTKAGDYKFTIIDVECPSNEAINLCLEGPQGGLSFKDLKIIKHEVVNNGGCITGLFQNLINNEYIVTDILPGDKISAGTSKLAILPGTGLHGSKVEWENNKFKLKILISPYKRNDN